MSSRWGYSDEIRRRLSERAAVPMGSAGAVATPVPPPLPPPQATAAIDVAVPAEGSAGLGGAGLAGPQPVRPPSIPPLPGVMPTGIAGPPPEPTPLPGAVPGGAMAAPVPMPGNAPGPKQPWVPSTPAEMGATPGFGSPREIAELSAPKPRGWKRAILDTALAFLAGGAPAAIGEAVYGDKDRREQQIEKTAEQYRQERADRQAIEDRTAAQRVRDLEIQTRQQQLAKMGQPEYAAAGSEDTGYYTYNKTTGAKGQMIAGPKPRTPSKRTWKTSYDREGNEFQYDPDDPEGTRRPTGGYRSPKGSTADASEEEVPTVKSDDAYFQDVGGMSAAETNRQLSAVGSRLHDLRTRIGDPNLTEEEARGVKEEIATLQQQEDDLRKIKTEATKLKRGDEERARKARSKRKTGVSAPKPMTREAAEQKWAEKLGKGSYDQLTPAEQQRFEEEARRLGLIK